ncbi:DNA-binding MarR family transcriptional regulator [Kribbella amoyensis]|uniref:DNA-binding MarR family transcriptional regulator n=1 Tax=Kribbella amoyensis TaxID=996641 RepID=A0A561BXS9_9ACTN|nr:MarR family transcriptional regulator [Kribbella amoyensis]TWD83651.1 DNA-binding MarR family transcriptional regulator [Kribbella amoyensis]
MQLAQQPSVPEVERDTPAQDVLEGVSSLIRAVRCIEHRQLWPDAGLRRADASVLKVLAKGGEQRGGEIAAKLGVDASVVSRQLTNLEGDGLVSRRPDPADARVSLVELSPLGRARLEALYANYTQQLRAALADWDDDAMTAAAETLRRVADAVARSAESVRRTTTSTGD